MYISRRVATEIKQIMVVFVYVPSMLQLGLTIAMIRYKNYKELQKIFEEFEIFSSPPIRLCRLEDKHKGYGIIFQRFLHKYTGEDVSQ